jgi:hypothetical protein
VAQAGVAGLLDDDQPQVREGLELGPHLLPLALLLEQQERRLRLLQYAQQLGPVVCVVSGFLNYDTPRTHARTGVSYTHVL